MAATANGDSNRHQPNAPQPSDKRVISSVVSHEKLMAEIKQRNPIIASRDEPKG